MTSFNHSIKSNFSMKFKANSKLDKFIVGVVAGLIVAFIITTIIINANIKTDQVVVWDFYKHFFKSPYKTIVLLSLKGGAIAVLPLFYLFLNKKMMKAVKGLIAVVAVIGLLVVWGMLS